MNEPVRLRDGEGAARRLMAGAVLHVPSASRRRAVAFTSAAASLGASTVAVTASAASVLKSFVVCVVIGAVGGGVMSLAASETIARLDQKAHSPAQLAPQAALGPAQTRAPSAPEAVASAAPAVETPAVVEAAPVAELSAKAAPSRSSGAGREELAPSLPERPAARAVPSSSLVEEQRIVESARAAVARGDLRAASAALDTYDRSYPAKQFGPEALALRIEALQGAGQVSQARALAADFARRYPHHPLLQRVQGVVGR